MAPPQADNMMVLDVDSGTITSSTAPTATNLKSSQSETATVAVEKISGAASSLGTGWEVPLVELKLENVTYAPLTVSGNANTRRPKSNAATKARTTVLHNITTTIAPYQLTAWMGPSGSGKSTILSVAADMCAPGDISADSRITVNGERGRIPKRLVCVVWQDDLLLSN